MSHTLVRAFFDEATNTASYVVTDPETQRAAIIDPVLDFELASGHTATTSAERIVSYVQEHGLGIDWILETHVHADHLSAAPYLHQELGGKPAELLGPYGQLTRDCPLSVDQGAWLKQALMARAFTIGGGTSEIQRSILATRALGLPRK